VKITTYRLPVHGLLKVFVPTLLVHLFPLYTVAADHLLLVPGLQQLDGDAALLLRLAHQTVHQHLLPMGLLYTQSPDIV